MRIIAILVTSDYRGDHSADVELAYEVMPNETVEQLVERLKLKEPDYIKILPVKEGGQNGNNKDQK